MCVCVAQWNELGLESALGGGYTHTHKCKYTGVLRAEVEVVLSVRVCVFVCVYLMGFSNKI